MTMERFFPKDFDIDEYRRCIPHSDEANLPDRWPIGYEDLRPYYQQAERLYRVRGAVDPLRSQVLDPLMDPPPLSAPSQELFDFLQMKGLHPYQGPLACEFVPGCLQCMGFACPKNCKNDSARICLYPAIEQYSAQLLDECEVTHIESTNDRVVNVICKRHDEELTLTSKVFILAGGAIHTPALLLKSRSRWWPNGLANRSGVVGANLMRHYFDLFCVATQADISEACGKKQLVFNDLYYSESMKYGTVQTLGRLASTESLVEDLWKELRRKRVPILPHVIRALTPVVKSWADRNISGRLVLNSVMEDLPYSHNRVGISNNKDAAITLQYQTNAHEKNRIEAFRKQIKSCLYPYKFTHIKNAENNERLGHVCGTCRFGDDPRASVLDANNRAHEIDNLYVVDSSFFPTSAGINPALTVAANALRVAKSILNS